jgi:hypothetical protein
MIVVVVVVVAAPKTGTKYTQVTGTKQAWQLVERMAGKALVPGRPTGLQE